MTSSLTQYFFFLILAACDISTCDLLGQEKHLCFIIDNHFFAAMAVLGNGSCPLQQNEGDIPILWHGIRSGVQGLRRTLRTLKQREAQISPFLINGIPVTPYKNPITMMSSNHIIRLWDSEPPGYLPYQYVVDLLVHDDDLYFEAFRRGRLTMEQFENLRNGDGEVELGKWFALARSQVPAFLNATPTSISPDHHDV